MISAVLFVIMVAFAHPISVLMQAPESAVSLTSSYVRICGGGIFFIVAYNLLSAIFRGLGDSKSPLLFVLVACIVNVIGDLEMCIRDRYFFTSCTLDESASNNGHYHSDKLEDLEKQMKQEFDADKRSDLAIQMQQTILDDNAYVFCSHLRMSMIMQSNVTGLTAHPCDYYELTADLDIN